MTLSLDEELIPRTVPLVGVCVHSPRDGTPGEILVLARLEKRDGRWALDKQFDLSPLGLTKRVFWPKDPPVAEMDGQCVKLHVYRRPEPDDRRQHPARQLAYNVAWKPPRNGIREWDVARFGYPVISSSFVTRNWELAGIAVPPEIRGASEFYVRMGAAVIGPFTVPPGARSRLTAPRGCVTQIPLNAIPQGIILEWDQGTVLVDHPQADVAQPVDLSNPAELAEWFAQRLEVHKEGLTASLDASIPGWRKRVGAELDSLVDPVMRELYKTRWRRFEEVLDHVSLEADDIGVLISTTPTLRKVLDQAVERAVEARSAEIEGAAQAQANELEGRVEQLLLDAEQAERIRKYEEDKALRIKAECEEKQKLLTGLISDLNASRERIVSDFVAFQALIGIGGLATREPTQADTGRQPSSRRALNSPPLTPACDDEDDFFFSLLLPHLARWVPGVGVTHGLLLHHALLCCPMTLVPSAAWARAYASAVGGETVFSVVCADPRWLSFADTASAGMTDFLQSALAHPDRLHLLYLDDINRAVVQSWCGPLVNVLSGISDLLPVDGGLPLPPNVRILAGTASDAAAFAVPSTLTNCCAALRRKTASKPWQGAAAANKHVPFSTWAAWEPPGNDIPDVMPDVVEFGLAALAATTQTRRLIDSFTMAGIEDEMADRYARNLRLVWPREYSQDNTTNG